MSLSSYSKVLDRYTITLSTSAVFFLTTSWASPGLLSYSSVGGTIVRTIQAAIYVLLLGRLVVIANKWVSERSYNNFVDDSSWDWPNEMAIVTGGSSGIGAEIVHGLARHNIRTIILDINEPTSKLGEKVKFYKVDLSSSSAISEVAATIKQTYGNPSILVNNAGTGTAQTILSETESERRRVFEVNVLCHFTLVREFLPAMVDKNHGHVMTIASTGSFYSQAQNVAYASSKAAVMAFHEGLGQELRTRFNARKVRTSIVYPDFVRTPLVEALTSKISKFPLAVMEPSEVASEAVNAILSTHGHVLILPRSLGYLALLRGLPQWVLRIVQTLDPDPLALVNI